MKWLLRHAIDPASKATTARVMNVKVSNPFIAIKPRDQGFSLRARNDFGIDDQVACILGAYGQQARANRCRYFIDAVKCGHRRFANENWATRTIR